jgi:Mg2+ and Co2+ transporter CorA
MEMEQEMSNVAPELVQMSRQLDRIASVFERMEQRENEEYGSYSKKYVEDLEKRAEELQEKVDQLEESAVQKTPAPYEYDDESPSDYEDAFGDRF